MQCRNVLVLTVLAFLAVQQMPALAQYPTRPVRLIVPFPAGGSTEFTARLLAEQLTKQLGQPVTVEPKPGNFGITAIEEIIGKGDGHTLMVGSIITNSMTPVLRKAEIKFDYAKEIVAVTKLADFPSVLMTATKSTAKTVKELLAGLKQTTGTLRFGTDFVGTYSTIDMLRLTKAEGINLAYRANPNGALGILSDLVDGKIDATLLNVATSSANIGKFKPLAVTSEIRLAKFPFVPTLAEAGYPGIGTGNWQGLFASAKVPPELIAQIHQIVVAAMADTAVLKQFDAIGARVTPSLSPALFSAEIAKEAARWESTKAEIASLPKVFD